MNYKGGDLEKEYNKLIAALKMSEAKAAEVRDRIRAVEDGSEALFDEWRAEMKLHSSAHRGDPASGSKMRRKRSTRN